MSIRSRLGVTLSAFAAVLLLAGCATTPGVESPTSTPTSAPDDSDGGDDFGDVEGVLLDDGRMFAVMTWGSSTCVPQVDEVSAEGQKVAVTLVDQGDAGQVCTADMAPRASIGALPEGVDPTQEVTLAVTYGELTGEMDLDGDAEFTGIPGSPTDYAPSAGWIGDGTLVLLTWGSSGCPPEVESIEGAGNAGTVTFVTDDTKMCTMDMAPRATLLAFGDDQVEDDDFTLTLVGGGLDGTVSVRG
ncbi:hypothetical protein MHM582_0375 [Microbacterium sp. HM58-2]|nr:hypothetical protein MHM582_0375 [Microbacterium sp. HM58-2]